MLNEKRDNFIKDILKVMKEHNVNIIYDEDGDYFKNEEFCIDLSDIEYLSKPEKV